MTLTRAVLVEQVGVKVIGVRSRENKRYGRTGNEYRQLCDVCSPPPKKKAGGVILEGTMGQRRYIHTNIYKDGREYIMFLR